MADLWKTEWERTRGRHVDWWARRGLVLAITAPAARPWADLPAPPEPASVRQQWLDLDYRVRRSTYYLSQTYFGGESFPCFDANIGPGSLATFIGSEPGFAPTTVWYEPCITDPESHPPLRFDPQDRWFQTQLGLVNAGLAAAEGRYLVGMPDLIENIDILASLRGSQTLMVDMLERPEWVVERVAEINQVYFAAFDRLREQIVDPWGGNSFHAFHIWGSGRTSKVQCDACAMFSPRMFRRFVQPALAEQCHWLDCSLYHLDGTQCIVHLDALLEIGDLDAIEWTPQAGIEGGGDPRWYDLYRRVLKGGKSMQAVGVRPAEVIPLLDAVGPDGMYLMVSAESEEQARALEERVDTYR